MLHMKYFVYNAKIDEIVLYSKMFSKRIEEKWLLCMKQVDETDHLIVELIKIFVSFCIKNEQRKLEMLPTS